MSEWYTRPHSAEDYGSAGTHEGEKQKVGSVFGFRKELEQEDMFLFWITSKHIKLSHINLLSLNLILSATPAIFLFMNVPILD